MIIGFARPPNACCVTINMKNIVVHGNIDIGGFVNMRGSIKLSGLLGEGLCSTATLEFHGPHCVLYMFHEQ